MSTSATLSDLATASSTPSPSSSSRGSSTSSASTSFYKNLFYILIGLLCAFGFVSFLSLMRARRRRTAILREAERLGVLVPGVPGYVPVRDRAMLTWKRGDGSESPEWWEIGQEEVNEVKQHQPESDHAISLPEISPGEPITFYPLGIVPPAEKISIEPAPFSEIPYFPNHLAYRPESLLPPPSRFKADEPATLDGLAGEQVEVLTIIQMPREPWPVDREVAEEEQVVKEWSSIELGMVKMSVVPRDEVER